MSSRSSALCTLPKTCSWMFCDFGEVLSKMLGWANSLTTHFRVGVLKEERPWFQQCKWGERSFFWETSNIVIARQKRHFWERRTIRKGHRETFHMLKTDNPESKPFPQHSLCVSCRGLDHPFPYPHHN